MVFRPRNLRPACPRSADKAARSDAGIRHSVSRPVFTLEELGSDINLDFTAFCVFRISGRVTDGVSGISNLTVTITTNVPSATTSQAGAHTVADLLAGTYEVAPFPVGAFSPASSNVVLTAAEVAGVNFTANRVTIALTMTNRQAQVSGVGLPTRSYQVQASTNVGAASAWQALTTVVAGTNGTFQYLDRAATNLPSRVYRTRTLTP